MARPIKNSCDYFTHDNDMRNHRKVKSIRNKFGIQGYAIWTMLIEYLTGIDGNEFEYSEMEFELISGDFGVSVTEIRDVVDYCIKLEMLFNKNGFVYSETLNKRLEPVYLKRGKAKEVSEKQKRVNGKFTQNTENTVQSGVSVTETPQSKVKEKKVNENILINNMSDFQKIENHDHTQHDLVSSEILEEPLKTYSEKKEERIWKDGHGDGELHEMLSEYYKNPLNPKYDPKLYKEFKTYWTALVQKGRDKGKERWRTEITFLVSGRLSTWNQNTYKNGNNSKKFGKNVPLAPTGIEPTNGRRFGVL